MVVNKRKSVNIDTKEPTSGRSIARSNNLEISGALMVSDGNLELETGVLELIINDFEENCIPFIVEFLWEKNRPIVNDQFKTKTESQRP